MKFSISTSFYRRSHLVEKLYKQILDQTHQDWEWIVTDDFSDYSNAEELLKEICKKDSRVKYYQQSRKKECFYNPQQGTTGEIVIQFDSDDYAYPRILEIYNHLFLKHPDVAGISCYSKNVNEKGEFVEIQGGGHYDYEETSTFNYTPMGRAWRNIIPSFDEGQLKWYQNDTNIVRYVETKGKWLYVPRTLYEYNYSIDTFSRQPGRSDETYAEIEAERLFIESKFPYLNNADKLTTSLYYLPIKSQSRDFAMGDFNTASSRQNILYVKEDIKVYERQLLKELFFDHNLYFDSTLDIKFDEVIVCLNYQTFSSIPNIIDKLKQTNPGIHIKLKFDERSNIPENDIHDLLSEKFPLGYGWCHGGYETYFITAL
jgi:glycosyltransferase involved in cell wall biosynthesis